MANTLLTPSIIAREAIMVLQNQMVFAGLVHRDFSDEFAKVGDTVTVRKPATFTAAEHNGTSITVQSATEGSVAVKMDKIVDVSFAVTSKELSLSIKDFSEQFIAPAMRAHAQYLDSLLAGLYTDIPYAVLASDTAAISDIAAIGKMMNVNKAPMDGRNLVLDPATYAKYIVLDAILHAEKSGATDALRAASMGRVLGLDSFMDQNVKTHTKGTLAATTGTLSVKGAVSAGATTATLDATALGGTVCVGDIFTVADASGQYVVTEAAEAATNEIAVKFYPAAPTGGFVNDKAVTIVNTAKANNLAFHRNAFALVTRPLATPLGAARAESLSFNGISVRVVYGYDMGTKTDTISLDFLCGVKTLTPELAVRFLN